MKKSILRIVSLLVCFVSLLSSAGCIKGHTAHTFDCVVTTDAYLKSEATCTKEAEYYYSCSCGEKGEETFVDGYPLSHDFTAEIIADKYFRSGTCIEYATYYKSCTMCGKKAQSAFFTTTQTLDTHTYTEKVAPEFIKEDATFQSSAVYYKSCVCGAKSEETFTHGDPLRQFTEEEKVPYTPSSLTVTMYDVENNIYGFTFNTESEPLYPVIQIEKGTQLTASKKEVAATSVVKTTVQDTKTSSSTKTIYVAKFEVELESNQTYTYRAYDKHVDVGTETATLNTKNVKATQFTFAHVSDTQVSNSTTGVTLGKLLSRVNLNSDFIVHTGDFAEGGESDWKLMLDVNFSYVTQIPIMAISGNHEYSYSKKYDTFNHFNNKLNGDSTKSGVYYSFVYGNVKFIMLDTNNVSSNKLVEAQYNWLENELKNNDAKWTVVAMHTPMYSVGKWGMGNSEVSNEASLALRNQLQGLFAQYKVDIVLQGHDHTVSRTYPINGLGVAQTENWTTEGGVNYSVDPNGVIYVMNGPGGTQTRNPVSGNTTYYNTYYKYYKSSNSRSWAEFSVDGDKITVVVKYTDGTTDTVYDGCTWGIKKTA